jgi:hypothetical protein
MFNFFSGFSSKLKNQIPFHPWLYFFIFFISDSLLSYFPLKPVLKFWVLLGGLATPFLLGCWNALENRRKEPVHSFHLFGHFSSEPVPLGFWFFAGALFISTRFYQLTRIPFWPTSDEGIFSMLAMGQNQNWQWHLVLGEFRNPPLFVWLLSLFFKVSGPSLLALRLFPTLLSALSAWFAYRAFRPFASSWFVFIFVWLFSFSFWEFLLMRMAIPDDLIPVWEFMALILFSLFLKNSNQPRGWLYLVLSGIWTGLGFYAYFNWAGIALWTALLLSLQLFPRAKGKWLVWAGCGALVFCPLALALLSPGGATTLQRNFGTFFSPQIYYQYARGLFENGSASYPLGPLIGGLLDPFSVALVFLGLLFVIQNWSLKYLALGAIGIWLGLAPGVLSNSFELLRLTAVLPFFIGLMVLGFNGLVFSKTNFRPVGGIFCLLGFFSINTYLFFGVYSQCQKAPPDQQWRSYSYRQAYDVLDSLQRRFGPLYVFSEFNLDYDDKTLNTACYPFDALQNPNGSLTQPQWAALLTGIDYAPFLKQEFPGLQFERLTPPANRPQLDLGLFLIPVSEMKRDLLKNWIQADVIYRRLNLDIKDKNPSYPWASFCGEFSSLENRFPQDHFLTAVYWEKTAFFNAVQGNYGVSDQSYRKAIQQGWPAPHLVYDLALVRRIEGK